VVGEDRPGGLDLELPHQAGEAPGVLGGDEVRFAERAHQPHRGIQRIADRGGGEGEDSGFEHPAMLATPLPRLVPAPSASCLRTAGAAGMSEHVRVPTEEEETPHAHRAAVEDEPRAVLASYRRRLHTFDLPLSRVAWAGAMALFGLALVLRLWGLGSI